MIKEQVIDLIEELERHWQLNIDKATLLKQFFVDLKKLCGVVSTSSIEPEIHPERIEELESEIDSLEYRVSELEDENAGLCDDIMDLEEEIRRLKRNEK